MSFQEVVYGDESLDELVGGQTSRQERHDLSAMTDLPARRSYLQHLAPSQIQDKSVWKCPDPNFNQNGNAMVTDKDYFGADALISHQLLHLSAVRNCQMVKMRDA